MSLLFKVGLLVPWAMGIFGCLQLHNIDLGMGHSVCGPWGCGASSESLLGFHGFWLLLLVPIALGIALVPPAKWSGRIGITLLAAALVALASYVIWDGAIYIQKLRPGSESYIVQRALFAVVTLVEVPLLQTVLMGLLIWKVSSRRQRVAPILGEDSGTL